MADSKLELVVTVDTEKANASIKSVNRGLSSIEATAVSASRGASRGLDGMTASMTQAVVAGSALYDAARKALSALQSLTLGSIRLQDEIGKTAQRVGLSVEAYSELRHVAELSGISAEQLATSTGILSRNMMDAAKGATEHRRAFEALGISFRDQSGQLRSVEDVLSDLADRFAAMPDDATKVALAMTLLGRSGREMIPFLNQGGAQIRVLRQEARELGIVVGEEAFRNAERFNDNLKRLRDALRGVAFALTNQFTPQLVELSDRMVTWIRTGGLQQAITYTREFAEALKAVAVAIASYALVTTLYNLAGAVTALNAALLANPWGLAAAGVAAFGAVVYRETRRTDEYRASLEAAAEKAQVFERLRAGATLQELRGAGIPEEQIRRALGAEAIEPIHLDVPVKVRSAGAAIDFEDIEERARRQKDITQAEQRAAELLRQAREGELTALPRVIAEYQRYQEELGASARAQRDLAAATQIRVQAEAREELRRVATQRLEAIERENELRNRVLIEQMRAQQEFARETVELSIDTARERMRHEEWAAEQARDAQLRELEMTAARTLEDHLTMQSRRLQIEEEYLLRRFALRADALRRESELEIATMEAIARARGIAEEQIAARRDAILQDYAERARQMEAETQAAIDAARENVAIRQAELIRDHNRQIFDSLKRQAEGVFDALLTRSQSVFAAIGNALKTAVLTAIKEIVTSRVAALLMQLFTGTRVTFAGAGAGGGTLGRLGGILGIGALPVFGGGMPAATPPFVPNGRGPGLAGLVSGWKDFLGIGGSVQLGPGLATTWQAATFWQKLGAIGRSPAAALAGGLLALAGLQRGGWSGMGMSTAGGALLGFKFGGPLGAAIGAGIGAIAGIVRLFVKGAEEKAREKIRATYGVDVRDKGILRQIVDTAKQAFGGNLDAAIRSQQIRDLVELYAMATGQSTAGLPPTVRPVSLLQQGGTLYQQTFTAGAAPTLDRIAAGTPQTAGPIVINISVPGAKEFFEKETMRVVVDNPRAVQSAAMTAMKANAGRRETAALQLTPGLITT